MSLERLFNPESIAIVGASRDFSRIGGLPIKLLIESGYKGRIYPVNPKYDDIGGLKSYPSISAIEEEIDVALLAVAADRALPIVKECVEKKVKFVDVFSSGFTEVGNEAGQTALLDAINGSDTRILGPNNQGVVNFVDNIPVAFSPLLDRGLKVPKGNIGIVAQSSGVGFSIMGFAAKQGVGFSHIATTGNQADIDVVELALFLLDDPATETVVCIVEGIKPGSDMSKLVSCAKQKSKRLVFLKLGRTEAGKKASESHSGSLAGDAEVFEAFCAQSGIILVQDTEELVDVLIALGGKKLRGDHMAILTGTGGAGIMAADLCLDFQLQVPALSKDTADRLREFLPSFASVQNPIDYTAQVSINDKEAFRRCLGEVSRDPQIDALLISFGLLTGAVAEKFSADIVEINQESTKPLYVFSLATEQPAFDRLREAGVPLYFSPYRCVRAVRNILGAHTSERLQEEVMVEAKTVHSLTEHESKRLLREYGIPVPRGWLAVTLEEARQVADNVGYPMVMKLMSPQITHKTDAGLVLLNINNEEEMERGWADLWQRAGEHDPSAEIQGVLMEEMLPKPVAEVFLGVKNDVNFGPVLLFGMGGVFVEVLGDIARRVLPLERKQILEMIASVKAYPLLKGYRGKPGGDLNALTDLILNVSRFAFERRELYAEMEINPIFLMPEGQGVFSGDALIIPS